jgi:CubicO group peptidase (beta-lactamase class C family)
MKKLLPFIIVLFISACKHPHPAVPPVTPASLAVIISDFSNEINADLKSDGLHGSMSVAIVKGDSILWSGTFGYAREESDKAPDTSTIYRAGSITKTFTATLMMILVQEGKIKLTDPVELYLPEIKKLKGYSDTAKITFLQLASHTAGLQRDAGSWLKGLTANSGPVETWDYKLLSVIPDTRLESKPGEKFNYSNVGYSLLGLALERAAGKPYIQLVQEKILDPLNMCSTFFKVPPADTAKIADGIASVAFNLTNTSIPRRLRAGIGCAVPCGAIFSTPNDLAKLTSSMLGYHPLLSPESLAEMETPRTNEKNKYGFGLGIIRNDSVNMVWHNGSIAGYTAQFAIEKDSKYAVIIMRNYNKGVTPLEKCSFNLLKRLKASEKAGLIP